MLPRCPLDYSTCNAKHHWYTVDTHFDDGATSVSFASFAITPPSILRMWQCSSLSAECVRLKIVDALLMLTVITSKQPSYTQYLYAKNGILIIDIQYWICKYYHFHPGASLTLNFWSTSIHIIWARSNVALSYSCTFGRQFTTCRSFH